MTSVDRSAARRTRRWAVGLGVLALLVYNANLRFVGTGDSMSSRFLPLSLWGWGTMSLDPILDVVRDGHAVPYWIMTSLDGEHVSMYPPVTPLLAAPLYAPAALYLQRVGWHPAAIRGVGEVMEKLGASVIAALGVGTVFLLLRRRLSPRDALLLAIAYAFGTGTWMISSQALWSHGATQLFSALGLLLLATTGRIGRGRAATIGFLCGLIVANRLPDAPLAAALGLALLASTRDRAARAAAIGAGACVVGVLLVFNVTEYGSVLGGYGRLSVGVHDFQESMARGLLGMLVSPGRGLLAYSPFLAFAALRFRRGSTRDVFGGVDACLALGIGVLFSLYASTGVWRSPYVYGPRMMVSALPFLVWILAPVLRDLRGLGRGAFIACVAFSIGVQCIGAVAFPADVRATREEIWQPARFPPWIHLHAPLRAQELPGLTRDLWVFEPLELFLAARADVEEGRVAVEITLEPRAPGAVPWPFTAAVDVMSPTIPGEAGFFGSWRVRLSRLEEATLVRFEIDPSARSADVTVDGESPETRDVAVGETLGRASEGEFHARIALSREDRPQHRAWYRVFWIRSESGRLELGVFPEISTMPVVLRASG